MSLAQIDRHNGSCIFDKGNTEMVVYRRGQHLNSCQAACVYRPSALTTLSLVDIELRPVVVHYRPVIAQGHHLQRHVHQRVMHHDNIAVISIDKEGRQKLRQLCCSLFCQVAAVANRIDGCIVFILEHIALRPAELHEHRALVRQLMIVHTHGRTLIRRGVHVGEQHRDG